MTHKINLGMALFFLLWSSCRTQQPEVAYVFQQPGWNFSCPSLTSDHHGHVLLTWAAMDTAGNRSRLWMARIGVHPLRVMEKFAVPHTDGVYPHGENLPKLACTNTGFWVLAFGTPALRSSNPYAGEVKYVYTTDAGKHWSAAMPCVTDTSSHDQRYFSLAPISAQEIAIIWMDDRLKVHPEGSTLFFGIVHPDGKITGNTPIAYNLCPCCRTAMLVDSQQVLHVAFRQILSDSIRDIVYMASFDHGQHFTRPKRVSADNWAIHACPHSGPSLAENAQGLQVVWYTLAQGRGIFYTHAAWRQFAPRQQVSDFNASAKHAQIQALPDGRLVIAWDEYPSVNGQNQQQAIAAHQRIGLQLRTADGKWLKTWYVSERGYDVQYPVLYPIGNNQLILAYTRQQGRDAAVVCRMVTMGR